MCATKKTNCIIFLAELRGLFVRAVATVFADSFFAFGGRVIIAAEKSALHR